MQLSENIFANFENMEELTSEEMQEISNNLCDMLRFIHNFRLKGIVVVSDEV